MTPVAVYAIWVILGAYLLYNLVQTLRIAYQSGLESVPGPRFARYSNLVLKWNVLGGRRTRYIHALHQQYGPMVRISPNEVAVADLEASRVIHGLKEDFPKGDWYVKIAPHLAEDRIGVFAMIDPKVHSARRRLLAHGFSKSSILRWEEPIKAKVLTAVTKIERDALAGAADILKWWTLMANDVICEVAFGEDFDAMGGEQKPAFVKDMEVSMIIGGITAELSFLVPILSRLPVPAFQRAFTLFDRLRGIGEIAIRNTRASTEKTIFSKITELSGKQHLSETAISQEASNLTVAGTDTTAIALTYLIWAVLQHPQVKQRLLTELDSSCPLDPTSKDLAALPYLNNVIDETLRLYTPISQSLPRAVPRTVPIGATGTRLAGYDLPPGTIVSTQAYTFHRDPAIFPDPLVFDPDRWLAPTREMKDAFMAWGCGTRSCLGLHIARLELMHGLCMFFRHCRHARIVAATTTPKTMQYRDFFIISPYGGKCEITLTG